MALPGAFALAAVGAGGLREKLNTSIFFQAGCFTIAETERLISKQFFKNHKPTAAWAVWTRISGIN